MPSTYTSSLKLELIANGEQATTWGETTNNNMGSLIEQAITGVEPITLTGNTELTNYNGLSDQSRNAVLVFNGSLANSANVVVPSVTKTYILSNRSGANVTVKTSSGNGVTLANGVNSYVYCDGINFFTAVDTSNITGDLTVSGNQTVGGNVSVGGNITLYNKISSNSGTLSFVSSTGVVDMASNTGAFTPPYGADADRPGSPELGMTRWNSTQGFLEIWNGVQWQNITGNYAIDYLVVGGGGGGGNGDGFQGSGGGGAGGFLSNSTTVTVGTAYTITVGSGGSPNAKGTNSSGFSLTSLAGGAGAGTGNESVISGSSGGGERVRDRTEENYGPGSGTAGQGYAGGYGIQYIGGGGGGSSQAGQSINGGSGTQSSISGSSTYYAGGGGGGDRNGGTGGAGGAGGGGNGSSAGTANTGGGGGGGPYSSGKAGGSGVVIIRYASSTQRATGGTVTNYTDAGVTYFVHTFTSSGTFTA